MHYESAGAFRMSLEQRLLSESRDSGVALDRLRRRVVYERIMVRLDLAEPGAWVMKGGQALDVRLGGRARATKDLDLGLREAQTDGGQLRSRLIEALTTDPDDDWFTFAVGPSQDFQADIQDRSIWRFNTQASLAGRPFGGVKLDISPRIEELTFTERLPLHNALAFAGIETRTAELIDINRHAAEKVHALTQSYGDRLNSRVRDLIDLVLLLENDYLSSEASCRAIKQTFQQRLTHEIPTALPDPPAAWKDAFERAVITLVLNAVTVDDAMDLVRKWWSSLDLEES